jgi:hypothetical protein
MNAVELLREQHREIERMFARLRSSKRPEEMQKLFAPLASLLVGHDAIEREIFYPTCERVLGKSEPLLEGIVEHGLIEYSLFLAEKGRGTDAFQYLVGILEEIVQHHLDEEEAELLPSAAGQMGDDMLDALGKVMEERFARATEHDFRKVLRANLERVVLSRPRPAAKRAPRKGLPSSRKPFSRAVEKLPRAKRIS